eukprot:jgi/Tetstr1/454319/TSEL_041238.t1
MPQLLPAERIFSGAMGRRMQEVGMMGPGAADAVEAQPAEEAAGGAEGGAGEGEGPLLMFTFLPPSAEKCEEGEAPPDQPDSCAWSPSGSRPRMG